MINKLIRFLKDRWRKITPEHEQIHYAAKPRQEVVEEKDSDFEEYLGFDVPKKDLEQFGKEISKHERDLYKNGKAKIKTSHLLFLMKNWPEHAVVNEEGEIVLKKDFSVIDHENKDSALPGTEYSFTMADKTKQSDQNDEADHNTAANDSLVHGDTHNLPDHEEAVTQDEQSDNTKSDERAQSCETKQTDEPAFQHGEKGTDEVDDLDQLLQSNKKSTLDYLDDSKNNPF